MLLENNFINLYTRIRKLFIIYYSLFFKFYWNYVRCVYEKIGEKYGFNHCNRFTSRN